MSIHFTCLLLAAIMVCCRPVAAQTNAPPAAGADSAAVLDLKQSAVCIERIKQLLQTVADLEADALSSNQLARAECIRNRHAKIVGLLDLSNESQSLLRGPRSDEVTEMDEAAYSEILLACARAEKIAVEAEACSNVVSKRPKRHRDIVPAEEKPIDNADRKDLRLIRQRKPMVRNEQTCLHQDRLASLLIAAMELRVAGSKSPNANTAALAKLAIEPLDGWQPNECATLDDLCVVVARALNLKVEKPDDPVSYAQALRDEGLPVDTLLPARIPNAPPPLLLESETRTFFLTGYAAPLPSSKRLLPD
jgi:hypothetical protein